MSELEKELRVDTLYHVFSDKSDEWYKTIEEAKAMFDLIKSGGNDCRLYEEVYGTSGPEEEELLEENVLESFGAFPC